MTAVFYNMLTWSVCNGTSIVVWANPAQVLLLE